MTTFTLRPGFQHCLKGTGKTLSETLTWERGHSLANVLWFISLSSSFKALRTVAWFHCSAGKSSNFEQLQNRGRVSGTWPSAMALAAQDHTVSAVWLLCPLSVSHLEGSREGEGEQAASADSSGPQE